MMKRYPPAGQAQPVRHTHHESGTAAARVLGARVRAPLARTAPGAPAAGGSQEQFLATLGYLGVIFFAFLPALVIYLAKGRSSPYVRYHCAQAVGLSVTVIVFDACAVIVGAMLALDTVTVSLSVVVPVATALWLVSLAYAVRAAVGTARGEQYELPRWLRPGLLR